MKRKWTDEQRKEASDRAKARHAAKKQLLTVKSDEPIKTDDPVKVTSNDAELRGKELEKNIRAPVGQETAATQLSQEDKVRMAMGRQLRLDLSFYVNLPEYKDMQLFWEEESNGAVEKWLHLGAILIPRKSKSLVHYKGFTDKAESEWECVPVGTDDSGKTLFNYAMALPKDEYHALRIAPKDVRNQEILNALGRGKTNTDEKIMPHVSGIRTYAPNNPVGDKKGFEQFEQTHEA